jgi:hypothetical protein
MSLRLARSAWVFVWGVFGLALAASGCGTTTQPMGEDDVGVDAARADASLDSGAHADADAGSGTCAGGCDDGLFCNGLERCVAGACAAAASPACASGVTCDEAHDTCATSCSTNHDADGDGTDSVACGGTDCDDADPHRAPTLTEICDTANLDEDCDPATFGVRDADADGFPDARCCNGTTCGDDCDDSHGAVHPGQVETCDALDNDCDTAIDESLSTMMFFPDCDLDLYGDMTATPVGACSTPSVAVPCVSGGAWVANGTDCDDTVTTTNPGAPELCNGVDDDCNASPDDGLALAGYVPDCDHDGYGDPAATPMLGCGPPAASPTCSGGLWATTAGDCADDDAARNPSILEACNATDDDCDGLVDDITDGVVVCQLGQMQACTNACGVAGTQTCNFGCTAYQSCSSTASEVCNYCDDDADGSLADDAALAMTNRTTAYFPRCESTFGESVCAPRGPATPPFFFDAVVLQGLANDRAGAVWLDPSTWVSGYGPVTVDVRMTVTGHPENGVAWVEAPQGGWAIVVATAGTPGVGTPREFGIPTGMSGIAARWHWNTRTTRPADMFSVNDSLSLIHLNGSLMRASGTTALMWNASTGTSDVMNGTNAADFGGAVTAVAQRMRIRYTPDLPATTAIDEERVELIVGDGSATVLYAAADGYAESPNGLIRPGSSLRIGITAGTYLETGQFYIPAGGNYGVPVEARVQLWRLQYDSVLGTRYDLPEATLSVTNVCAP